MFLPDNSPIGKGPPSSFSARPLALLLSAAERTVPGKDCTWEGSYQPRADCTWNFLITNFTNPKARHLQVQSARGAGEVSTLSEKNNVRERLGPERTVPGKTVPEFLTSGTVNLFQVQSARELAQVQSAQE